MSITQNLNFGNFDIRENPAGKTATGKMEMTCNMSNVNYTIALEDTGNLNSGVRILLHDNSLQYDRIVIQTFKSDSYSIPDLWSQLKSPIIILIVGCML